MTAETLALFEADVSAVTRAYEALARGVRLEDLTLPVPILHAVLTGLDMARNPGFQTQAFWLSCCGN